MVNLFQGKTKPFVMLNKLSLLFFVLTCLNFQNTSGQNQFYDSLNKNKIPFEFKDLSNILSGTRIFPEKKLFLFGELHGINANLELQYGLIKYLHKEKGISNIIIEMPHSEVYFFQKYLETGDTSLLYNYDGRVNKYFLDKIRVFNKNTDYPIRLFGIDLDIKFRSYFYADCIIHLTKKYQYADSISAFGKALHQLSLNRYNSKKLFAVNEILKKELRSNEATYSLLFGKDYLHLKTIVFSFKKDKGRRDDEMFENFKSLYKTWFSDNDNKAGFLAFLGGSHTYSESKQSFYRLLQNNNTSPVFNDVSLSAIQYINCQSSQFSINPQNLIAIINDGFFRGSRGANRTLIKNNFLTAIESISSINADKNYIIPANPNQLFQPWYNKNKLLETIDMLFIIQKSPPTHPLTKSTK